MLRAQCSIVTVILSFIDLKLFWIFSNYFEFVKEVGKAKDGLVSLLIHLCLHLKLFLSSHLATIFWCNFSIYAHTKEFLSNSECLCIMYDGNKLLWPDFLSCRVDTSMGPPNDILMYRYRRLMNYTGPWFLIWSCVKNNNRVCNSSTQLFS